METLLSQFTDFSQWGIITFSIGLLIFILLILLIPIHIYLAQKWAYKCFKEIEKINNKFDNLYDIIKK